MKKEEEEEEVKETMNAYSRTWPGAARTALDPGWTAWPAAGRRAGATPAAPKSDQAGACRRAARACA